VYVVGAPLGVAAEETDPQLAPSQVMLQVTPLPDESLLTVALNCAVACGCTVAEDWERETLMAGTVIATEADFPVSATALAVRVTIIVTPGGPGAVYVVGAPLGVAVEETDPQLAPLQVMLQVTPLPDESLLTVALNCAVACGCTVAEPWDTDTVIAGGGGWVIAELPPQPELLATLPTTSTPIGNKLLIDSMANLR
jgi:hypothetical protein